MTTPEQLPVVQADRDAAAEWFALTNSLGIDHTGKAFEDALRDGSYDGDRHPLVQLLAKHRLASQPATEGLLAKAAEAIDQLERCVAVIIPENMRPDTTAAKELLAEIRGALQTLSEPQPIGREGEEARQQFMAHDYTPECGPEYVFDAGWDAAKRALSTPAQAEPVAWVYEKNGKRSIQDKRQEWNVDRGWTETPLYAHPPAPTLDREAVVERIVAAIKQIVMWDGDTLAMNATRDEIHAIAQAALDAALPLLRSGDGPGMWVPGEQLIAARAALTRIANCTRQSIDEQGHPVTVWMAIEEAREIAQGALGFTRSDDV